MLEIFSWPIVHNIPKQLTSVAEITILHKNV